MRKLKADEIECRVQTVKQNGVSLLLYKTARVDRAILDEEFGSMNWQNDFKVIDGKMYGSISVWDKEKSQWITKADCGTESNTEAEKGQASDCFKRAGFKWGIGVELYTAPFIWIKGDGNDLKYVKYHVSYITYAENGDIDKLIIKNDKGEQVYTYGFKPSEKKIKPQEKDDIAYYEALGKITDRDALVSYYELNKENVNDKKVFHEMVNARANAIKELNKEVA
jgi:hypothetical protein